VFPDDTVGAGWSRPDAAGDGLTRHRTMRPMLFVYIAIAVLILLVIWGIVAYNRLVRLRNRTQNSWAQIDVQLKKRHDLVPNLVETVKGYAAHEKGTFEAVVEARNAAVSASGVADKAQAENMLTGALRSLFALAEDYPELRATENFQRLQADLGEIEGDIAVSRQIFNDSTLSLNNAVETFPSNIVAGMTGFERGPFFEVEDEGRSAPKVEF
jgi:LemA protein